MAARRLIDAAKLFNASRSVANKHIALRASQYDAYTKTSTLAKAVKDQTDRITLTASAAIALSKRFREEVPSYAKAAAEQATSTQREDILPRETVESDVIATTHKAGVEQVHHYKKSEKNITEVPTPKQDLEIEQQEGQRQPLADGTILASGLTSEREYQGQDTFSKRSETEAPKKPLAKEDEGEKARRQSGDLHPVESDESTIPLPSKLKEAHGGSSEARSSHVNFVQPQHEQPLNSKSEEEIPEGINTDVFHSKRVARMLGSDPFSRKEHASGKNAGRHPFDDRPLPRKENRDSTNINLQPQITNGGRKSQSPKVNESSEHSASQLSAESQSDTLASELFEGVNTNQEQIPYALKESPVPSSRIGRIWQYASLGSSMVLGAVGEGIRQATGSAASAGRPLMLSPGNLEILVAKLSRMRGAALKLGQMISFQDIKMLPPEIHNVLERVQDGADYMPTWQRDRVLSDNLGPDWRNLFESFDDMPIAAASIGQVHKAVMKSSGTPVAVKVQYPGVAGSIDSDLSNLSMLLTASRLLPKGLYLDKTIANARTELGWECDYVREAASQMRFRDLLVDDTDVFTVPKVFKEASGGQVLTAEFMTGTGVTKAKTINQKQRDWIGTQILRLCLREIIEFKFMQTDPNWTNFLFNAQSQKIELLDFGASRDYPDEFVEPYINILIAASKGDRESIREQSLVLGYLTGSESAAMLNAHVDSVLTLAEPFSTSSPREYDFSDQTITDRVRSLIPVMMRERLAPPPEETYSLHRKLSGAFLLCARLGSRVKCGEMFEAAIELWRKKKGLT